MFVLNRRSFVARSVASAVATVALPGYLEAASGVPDAARDAVRRQVTLDVGWRFAKEPARAIDETPEAEPGFDDRAWDPVGVPHCYNDLDSFQNAAESETFQGTTWYRTRFKVPADATKGNVFLEFEGVTIAAAVYINGRFKAGNTKVAQPGKVTHVGDFLPFALDITDDLRTDGDNVLAVRVSNMSGRRGYGGNADSRATLRNARFFTDPGFGTYLGFGMGFGGIVAPVTLHFTSKVYVPRNVFSPAETWGTYLATLDASAREAKVLLRTNVRNDAPGRKSISLTTRVIDPSGKTVATLSAAPVVVSAGAEQSFDQTAEIASPALWFPNNSPHGRPLLYTVETEVYADGARVDRIEETLGIRVLTWDGDYCYVNGEKHLLNGFGQRNIYPALGGAVPAELQWRDISLIAQCGGNALRVGHVPASLETVRACDALGVLVMQNSGDNEWSLQNEPALTYKREYDRDMMVAFRNRPSIAVWESNNGLAKKPEGRYSPKETFDLARQWDPSGGRIVSSRDSSDFFPTDAKLMIGRTNAYAKVADSPSINLEVYGAFWGKGDRSFGNGRADYAYEKQYADFYVTDYLRDLDKSACGWIAWMLAETQGESYVTYLNGMSKQKSLGSCAMDGNRFPKITYNILKHALWRPFPASPGVTLQSHWNLYGVQDVDAWSNCPRLELFLNGRSMGSRDTDPKRRCTWQNVQWEAGLLKVVGYGADGAALCSDSRQSSGPAHRIELAVEERMRTPSGTAFPLRANGSDVALVTAKIVDEAGVWCPLADHTLKFSVEGPAVYKGSYNFYVTPGKPLTYHAPGDTELQAEGGLMRVALRTSFAAGTVQVHAKAEGLVEGSASFAVSAI
jgi:hypothetical protein